MGRIVFRGERPIKLRGSWFSAKSIQVEAFLILRTGRALEECGGCCTLPSSWKLQLVLLIKKMTQTVGAKIHSQKGNNPEHKLRALKII